MPIYEYRCEACQHELEALQKISDQPLQQCPKCNQSALRKMVSAAGFRLKGGGWYETDFKSGGKKNVAGENNSEIGSKGENKADSAKSDAPAKPAEAKPSAPAAAAPN